MTDQINLARILALRSALKLEVIGMKKRGRSAYSIIKEEFSLKGNKEKVFKLFDKIVEDLLANK